MYRRKFFMFDIIFLQEIHRKFVDRISKIHGDFTGFIPMF